MNCQFVEREKRNGKRENKPANAMVMMRVYNKRPTINVRQQIQLGADPGIVNKNGFITFLGMATSICKH
jgi:hypothetical protein